MIKEIEIKLNGHTETAKTLLNIGAQQKMNLVYVSVIPTDSKENKILFDNIIAADTIKIVENNIKGFLCGSEQYLFYFLEGTKAALLPLLAQVFKNKQRYTSTVIQAKCVDSYHFSNWKVYDYDLEHRTNSAFASQLQGFKPFRPLDWQDWRIDHFVNTVEQFTLPVVMPSKNIIRYPYRSDINIFLLAFVLPIIIGILGLLTYPIL